MTLQQPPSPLARDLLKARLLPEKDAAGLPSARTFAGVLGEMFYPTMERLKSKDAEIVARRPDPMYHRYASGFWKTYSFSRDQSPDARKLRELFIFRRELEFTHCLRKYFEMVRHSRVAHKWDLDAELDKIVYVGGTDREMPAPPTYLQSLDEIRTAQGGRSIRQVIESAADEARHLLHLGGAFRVLYEMTKYSTQTELSKWKAELLYSTAIVAKPDKRGTISTSRLKSLWHAYGDVAHCWAAFSELMDHPDPVTTNDLLDFVEKCDVERFFRLSATFADFGLGFRQKRRGDSSLIQHPRGLRDSDMVGLRRETDIRSLVPKSEWVALEKYKPSGADSDLA